MITYFPLFAGTATRRQPGPRGVREESPITITADQSTCNFHIFVGPWSNFTQCDRAQDFMTKSGLSFKTVSLPERESVDLDYWILPRSQAGMMRTAGCAQCRGYPAKADLAKVNWFMTELILVIMVIYVTMVYGRIAAFLVEMFPTHPDLHVAAHHIGNGWFGGMLPLLATAVVAVDRADRRRSAPDCSGADDPDRGIAVPATPRASISTTSSAWRSRRAEPTLSQREGGASNAPPFSFFLRECRRRRPAERRLQ